MPDVAADRFFHEASNPSLSFRQGCQKELGLICHVIILFFLYLFFRLRDTGHTNVQPVAAGH
jgi:hypothetical protein